MEEEFFVKRLSKKEAVIKGLVIIVISLLLCLLLTNVFDKFPLNIIIFLIWSFIFLYGVCVFVAPFTYDLSKKYFEKLNIKIDTPYVFIYKHYLIKWGKTGAFLYRKSGIIHWIIKDVEFNSEEDVKKFLDDKSKRKKMICATPPAD